MDDPTASSGRIIVPNGRLALGDLGHFDAGGSVGLGPLATLHTTKGRWTTMSKAPQFRGAMCDGRPTSPWVSVGTTTTMHFQARPASVSMRTSQTQAGQS